MLEFKRIRSSFESTFSAAFLPASRGKNIRKHCDASFAACILGGNEAMEPDKRNVSTIVNGNRELPIY